MAHPVGPLVYPQTRYEPSPLVDLASRDTRERLGPAGVRAFFRIAEHWGLRDEEARALLGMSHGPYYELKKKPRALDEDRTTRISCLIGIFKALHILHGQPLADRWISLPNTNRIFAGRSPLETMIKGGLPAMLLVRRLLDARRGGT